MANVPEKEIVFMGATEGMNSKTVIDTIKNCPPSIFNKPAPSLLSQMDQVYLRLGAARIYGWLYCDWLHARIVKKRFISFRWGKLNMHTIEVFDNKGKEAPIMEFEEFFAWLQVSYINY
jgi:hypothetical protein